MTYSYNDSALLEVNGDRYVVHGYHNDDGITVTRPVESLYDFELEEIERYLEEG